MFIKVPATVLRQTWKMVNLSFKPIGDDNIMNLTLMTVFSEFLTSFRSAGLMKGTCRTEFLEIFQQIQFHAACHCFGSQMLTVALPLPSLNLKCCGIRGQG